MVLTVISDRDQAQAQAQSLISLDRDQAQALTSLGQDQDQALTSLGQDQGVLRPLICSMRAIPTWRPRGPSYFSMGFLKQVVIHFSLVFLVLINSVPMEILISLDLDQAQARALISLDPDLMVSLDPDLMGILDPDLMGILDRAPEGPDTMSLDQAPEGPDTMSLDQAPEGQGLMILVLDQVPV